MSATQIKSVSLKHEALLDYMISNPFATLREVANECGYTVPWLSILVNSDLFKGEMNRRRGFIEEDIRTDVRAHLNMVVTKGLQAQAVLIDNSLSLPEVASATESALKALGFGEQKKQNENVVNQTFVFSGGIDPELLKAARANFGKPLSHTVDGEFQNVLPAPARELEQIIEDSASDGESV